MNAVTTTAVDYCSTTEGIMGQGIAVMALILIATSVIVVIIDSIMEIRERRKEKEHLDAYYKRHPNDDPRNRPPRTKQERIAEAIAMLKNVCSGTLKVLRFVALIVLGFCTFLFLLYGLGKLSCHFGWNFSIFN